MLTPPMGDSALVLSGGGMFGAYQAGAWSALSEFFKPDIVVGASVGSLNGWVIAGGIDPKELSTVWLDPIRETRPALRFPRSLRDGFLNPKLLEGWIQSLYRDFQPRCRFGVALTEM